MYVHFGLSNVYKLHVRILQQPTLAQEKPERRRKTIILHSETRNSKYKSKNIENGSMKWNEWYGHALQQDVSVVSEFLLFWISSKRLSLLGVCLNGFYTTQQKFQPVSWLNIINFVEKVRRDGACWEDVKFDGLLR